MNEVRETKPPLQRFEIILFIIENNGIGFSGCYK